MPQKTKRAEPRPYHHGDLRTALLREAEAILESDGMPGLTLRAISRRAGVSHAAPNNHFGDLTGLLSELAAVGYTRFGAMLSEAMTEAGEEPRARLKAMGRAYVGFARRHPGLFSLMFRSEALDASRPALRDAIAEVRTALRVAASARAPRKTLTPLELAAEATALWSLVHGFSVLMLDGRLDGTIKALPGREDSESLLEAVLMVARVGHQNDMKIA
jgi:AcrR family transcriptional regulator